MMKKITMAIIGLTIAVATLATALPHAAAAEGDPAGVRVTNSGDLLVRVKSNDINIQINGFGAGNYAVWVTDSDGQLHVYNALGVTRHARVEYRHHLGVAVDFGDLTPTSVPADLRISGESNALSGNTFTGHDAEVGDDLVFKGDTRIEMIGGDVADDFVVYPASGHVKIDVSDTVVGGRFYVRRSNTSSIELRLDNAETGSFSVSGGRLRDFVSLNGSDLGLAPRILLQEDEDTMQVDTTYWEGALFFRGGEGRDSLGVYGKHANLLFDVALQDGPDFVFLEESLDRFTAGSSFNGGDGFDRITGVGADLSNGRVVKFEEVNP